MPEETITFELIRRIQRKEQSAPKLTKLPKGLYQNVKAYLDGKRRASKERRVAVELKNIERLVEDIFNRRERKILNLALITARTNIPPENLTEEEKEFFNKLIAVVKRRREGLLERVLAKEKEELVRLIVFKADTPQFVGADTKSYGPFKKGDIARLPEENMRVLIEQGIAEEFKVSK